MPYTPKVNDYVIWKKEYGGDVEGWVYFMCNDYITIEVGVKDKCDENYRDCPIHKKTHILVLCYTQFWHQLEYVTKRDCKTCNPVV